MIADFHVRNFSCIREETSINFYPAKRKNADEDEDVLHEVAKGVKLLKLGVIYGMVGKTTMLKALRFFCELMTKAPSGRSSRIAYDRFMLDDYSRDEDTEMRLSFYIDGTKYDASVVFDNDMIRSESIESFADGRKLLLYRRRYDAERGVAAVSFGRKVGLSPGGRRTVSGNTMKNCSVLAAFGRSNAASTQLSRIFDYLNSILLQPISQESPANYICDKIRADKDGRLKEFLLESLYVSDLDISDIRLVETVHTVSTEVIEAMRQIDAPAALPGRLARDGSLKRDTLLFLHGRDGERFELEEECESSGTIRFLGLMTLLFEILSRDAFLMIDELGAGMHYSHLATFLRSFLKFSKGTAQMLVTTHTLDLLDEDFLPRDTAWFTGKDFHNAVSLVPLSDYKVVRSVGSISMAYRNGRFGYVPSGDAPFLSDEYFSDVLSRPQNAAQLPHPPSAMVAPPR